MDTLLVVLVGAVGAWLGVLAGALALRAVLEGTRRALERVRRS